MSSPFGFDENEDYYNSLDNICYPIKRLECEEHEPLETYRLDEWNWDETLADEKSDVIRTVNRRCNLITLLGGRAAAVIQLHKDIQNNNLQLAKCLLKREDLDMNELIDPLGKNMLHVAASCGNNLAVALAIRHGMDINKTTVYGSTPLMLSCAWGKEVTCDLLLDFNADPTIKDRLGRTALSLASNGLRIHLLKHTKMKSYFIHNKNEIEQDHSNPHNIINAFQQNITNTPSYFSSSNNDGNNSNNNTVMNNKNNIKNNKNKNRSVIGDDMDEKWKFAIQHGFLDDNFSKGHRVSENYNICLYSTVVNSKEENNN